MPLTNSQIIELFSNNTDHTKTADSPLFVSSGVLYAYGYHYPLAAHKQDDGSTWINCTKRGRESEKLVNDVITSLSDLGLVFVLSDLPSLKNLIQAQAEV